MYGNVRRSNVNMQGMVPIEAVRQIMNEMQNPIKPEKLKEGDGGALMAYWTPKINFKKH